MKNKIQSIDVYSNLLSIVWDSGESSFINLQLMREACPCAFCSGEKDVFGNVYKGKPQLSESYYLLSRFEKIGLYGVRLFWEDNHHDGIYTYEMLFSLSNQ